MTCFGPAEEAGRPQDETTKKTNKRAAKKIIRCRSVTCFGPAEEAGRPQDETTKEQINAQRKK